MFRCAVDIGSVHSASHKPTRAASRSHTRSTLLDSHACPTRTQHEGRRLRLPRRESACLIKMMAPERLECVYGLGLCVWRRRQLSRSGRMYTSATHTTLPAHTQTQILHRYTAAGCWPKAGRQHLRRHGGHVRLHATWLMRRGVGDAAACWPRTLLVRRVVILSRRHLHPVHKASLMAESTTTCRQSTLTLNWIPLDTQQATHRRPVIPTPSDKRTDPRSQPRQHTHPPHPALRSHSPPSHAYNLHVHSMDLSSRCWMQDGVYSGE